VAQRDEIRMKILEDGVVSVDTGAFSEELHLEAEQLIKEVFDELGGESQVVEKKPHDHQHGHSHVQPTVPVR
jgi:hypothetical protein